MFPALQEPKHVPHIPRLRPRRSLCWGWIVRALAWSSTTVAQQVAIHFCPLMLPPCQMDASRLQVTHMSLAVCWVPSRPSLSLLLLQAASTPSLPPATDACTPLGRAGLCWGARGLRTSRGLWLALWRDSLCSTWLQER